MPNTAAAAAASAIGDKIEGAVAALRANPAVERVLAHPSVQQIMEHSLGEHFPVLVATVAGLFIILLLFACTPASKTTKGMPTVLLVGPPDSGKTSLFTKLSQSARPATHTSLVPSTATVRIASSDGMRVVRMRDLAGHARLRDQVARAVGTADGVVFVVDAQTLARNPASVAEELPPLLAQMASAGLRRANPLRLLICAHKADLLRVGDKTVIMPAATAVAAQERVRSILTREMDRLKGARGRAGGRIEGMARVASGRGGWFSRLFGGSNTPAPTAEDEDDDAAVWGGAGGFRWDDVDGVDVAWGASALGPAGGEADVEEHDGGLDELTEFMAGL